MSEKRNKRLRTGFTTGTAAAAATKAALIYLLSGRPPSRVPLRLLTGEKIDIAVEGCRRFNEKEAACTVIKDAGDDPDVTHKAEIGAHVTLLEADATAFCEKGIHICGGRGVGRVTKPGLEVPVGQAAINSGPRKMITQAAEEVLKQHGSLHGVRTRIFVPKGEALARRTLNARLGIVGGISILGTTGLVRPLSHEAFVATIESALSVALATGQRLGVLSTGRRSERFAMGLWPHLPEEAFVQMGDFFKVSLEAAAARKFQEVRLVAFFGKAVKMARAVPVTHAAKAQLTLEALAGHVEKICRDKGLAKEIASANTARQAFGVLRQRCPEAISHTGFRVLAAAKKFAGSIPDLRVVILDYEGRVSFDSKKEKPKDCP